jgi:hypothetical protein
MGIVIQRAGAALGTWGRRRTWKAFHSLMLRFLM